MTNPDNTIKASVANVGGQNNRSRNNNPRPGGGAKFLHFTLYKENRDTADAVKQIKRLLNLGRNRLNTAGTKDRRAVTVQRVSMPSRDPQSLLFINGRIPGVKIGDFKFEQKPLYLGSHQGNEFIIVLKNCGFGGAENLPFDQKLKYAESTLASALTQLAQRGFINYFGTQRFGTFEIGTQETGMKLLGGDFEGAVKDLLAFNPAHLPIPGSDQDVQFRQDTGRAQACSTFLSTGSFREAEKYLPFRCHNERTLMQHLDRNPSDFLGALQKLDRQMRTLYVHAYQSFVWNFVASMRWERYGTRVIEGDLVLTKSEAGADQGDEEAVIADEETIHLIEGDAMERDTPKLRAHSLTEEEANSGNYTIFDVVLPTPGWDVTYPSNEIGQFYVDFMGRKENGGLNPAAMRRSQKEYSLPGTYRNLMGKTIKEHSFNIREYHDDTEQLVQTDLDAIKSREEKKAHQQDANMAEWKKFAQNPEEFDKKADEELRERRKAEEELERPDTQVTETWIQTSLDQSNKRIKVARHVLHYPLIPSTVASKDSDIMQINGKTPTSVATPTAGQTPTGSETPAGRQTSTTVGHDGTKDPATDNAKIGGGSLISGFTAQVRKIVTYFTHPLLWLCAKLGFITNTNITKTVPPPSPPSPESSKSPKAAEQVSYSLNSRVSTNPAPPNTPNESIQYDEPLTHTSRVCMNRGETAASTSIKDTKETSSEQVPWPTDINMSEETSPKQTSSLSSTSDTTDKKIAVILRFALGTGQFATIVLRELQGAPSELGTTDTVSSLQPN